jgi:serine/threonine protein kinase
MSFLYLGHHPVTSKQLALKVLSPNYLKNKEAVDRFLKEARIISMSNHPNIIRLYSQGEWEQGLYIAMEFIKGTSLREFTQKNKLHAKKALEILLQVSYALCHLHTHGIVHRDIKPENILITDSGEIKVIDFGIAQLHGSRDEEHLSEKKRFMGTPVYMSPEQKKNPRDVSPASDIYSLGVIACELMLGSPSHSFSDTSRLPTELRPIVEKALRPDPKERYRDIVDFITDLSQCIQLLSSEKNRISKFATDVDSLDLTDYAHSYLSAKEAPDWPFAEIGIALNDKNLYLDFFPLSKNRLAIALASPQEQNETASLFSNIHFRGALRASMEFSLARDFHPVRIVSALNDALCCDPVKKRFSFALLLLCPEDDHLSFISCSCASLCHLPYSQSAFHRLETPNGVLGVDPNALFLQTDRKWREKDLLILHSNSLNIPSANELLKPEIQGPIENGISKPAHADISMQNLAQLQLKSASKTPSNHGLVLSIRRKKAVAHTRTALH